MWNRAPILIAITLLVLLLAAPVRGERLGGAYRGHRMDTWVWPDPPPPPANDSLDFFALWPFWFEHNKEWILADRIRERRAGSIGIAEEHRARVVPLLTNCIEDESPWVRDAAVIALGKLGGEEAVVTLAGCLHRRPFYRAVRQDALLALGLTGETMAFAPLVGSLSDEQLQSYAALGLGILGHERALPRLLERYATAARPNSPTEDAYAFATAIGLLGDESHVDALARPLKARRGDARLKAHVCQALGRIGGEAAEKWLLRALQDKNRRVSAAAILALSNFPGKRVVASLLSKRGVKSGNRMCKLFALLAVGSIGRSIPEREPMRKKIRADLMEAARSTARDRYAPPFALFALALMGDELGGEIAIEVLEGGDAAVSDDHYSAAVMAAGLLRHRPAAPYLRAILSNRTMAREVRGSAALALALMDDRESLATIRRVALSEWRHADLARPVLWAIGLLGDRLDLPWLIECLRWHAGDVRDHSVRGAAAIAIGMIGESAAVDPLIALANESRRAGDHNSSNRAFAIAALGCLLDRASVPRMPLIFKHAHYREQTFLMQDVMSNL